KNLVLIGMPSAGKSTVGVIVAKNLCMSFIDTDVLLQTLQGRLLQDIINKDGTQEFLKIEESTIISLNCENTVIATGGSAIYSEKAMNHLKRNGIVIYLHIDLDTVNQRLNNIKTRGVVLSPGQTLEQVYSDRKPLYEKYADITIDCSKYSIDTTINTIHQRLTSLS
ncbi:MAG: shikimate kinase, partial [Ruminiclostridium sp.]